MCTNTILGSRELMVNKTDKVHDFIMLISTCVYVYVCLMEGKTGKGFYYKIKKSTYTYDNINWNKFYGNIKQYRGTEYDVVGKEVGVNYNNSEHLLSA